jgi:hypothetical protein
MGRVWDLMAGWHTRLCTEVENSMMAEREESENPRGPGVVKVDVDVEM